LEDVLSEIYQSSFGSAHVVTYGAFFGFLKIFVTNPCLCYIRRNRFFWC